MLNSIEKDTAPKNSRRTKDGKSMTDDTITDIHIYIIIYNIYNYIYIWSKLHKITDMKSMSRKDVYMLYKSQNSQTKWPVLSNFDTGPGPKWRSETKEVTFTSKPLGLDFKRVIPLKIKGAWTAGGMLGPGWELRGAWQTFRNNP